MILVQNVGAGDYPFIWDGGIPILTLKASTWGGTVSVLWQDELGDYHDVGSTNTDGILGFNGPPGEYILRAHSGVVGLSATLRRRIS